MSRVNLEPQAKAVLDHLMLHGSVTNMEANVVLKVRSVSRRITDISRAGYTIAKKVCHDTTGQRYVRYILGEYKRGLNVGF